MTSTFFQRVHDVVALIPRGHVVTYGQIALHLGMPHGARTAGWALHGCPSHLPWHRVVNARGGISRKGRDLSGALQRALLEEEGVVFDESGHIDLSQFGWDGI
jgi:methylated-DNA-protein-cysteine methyltransferase-like protein